MRRLRWGDREEESGPLGWRDVAALSATPFLNFAFFWAFGAMGISTPPLALFLAVAAAAAVLSAAVFFAGPLLALRRAGRPWIPVLEGTLGRVPAWGVRIAGLGYAAVWIGMPIEIPERWFGDLMLVFGCLTTFAGDRTEARLARFTNRLAFAVLVAGVLRIREGWPAAVHPSPYSWAPDPDAWRTFTELTLAVAPAAFFAARLGYGMPERRGVLWAAADGIALPLFVAVLGLGIVEACTYPAGYGQPSLAPSLPMALWGKASSRGLPLRFAVASITLFGALRFFLKAAAECVTIPTLRGWAKWIPFSVVLAAVLWKVPSFWLFGGAGMFAATLAAASGILTAGWLARFEPAPNARLVDPAGCAALLAGILMSRAPWFANQWRPHDGMIPAYLTAFTVALAGRLLLRQHRDAGTAEGG